MMTEIYIYTYEFLRIHLLPTRRGFDVGSFRDRMHAVVLEAEEVGADLCPFH